MKGLLLSLGLVALFALCAQSDMYVQHDFKDDKIIGKWYSIAVAYNSDWFKSYTHLMSMSTTVITPNGDGSLENVYTHPTSNTCLDNTMRYFKTDQPGRFRATWIRTDYGPRRVAPIYIFWAGSGQDYDVRFIETNYEEYAMMSMRNTEGPDIYTTFTLLGRSKELRREVLTRFHHFCLKHGIAGDNFLILPNTGQCMTEAY
ncbi:lipocalin-like isoform X4 [Ascaphus truei]|uniref:lipocalin-like isoform X4 n=1 Tax=Ascaphus truei TaxID=8439 RepID=UPI003F5A1042